MTAWSVVKWPVLAMVIDGPDRRCCSGSRRTSGSRGSGGSPSGGAVALLSWIVVSFGFGLYVANFGSYDMTYGSLGAVIAFLVWLYLSNSALMFGVEINAEIERGRELQAGLPGRGRAPAAAPRPGQERRTDAPQAEGKSG